MDTKVTQVQFKEGLFELSEESLRELQGSKYLNDDLRPTTGSERTWTTYNVGMLWVGMVICIAGCSFAAALIALGFSPMVALLNVLIGNLIVLIPMQLNSHAGTRYGIPFPVFSRITFGKIGAQVPSLVRAVVACGWCSIQCWVAGAAVSAIIGVFSSSWDQEGTGRFIGFAIFLLFNLAIAWKGSSSIKWLEAIGSPILLLTCVALVVWVVTTGHANGITVGEMFFAPGDPEMVAANGGAVFLFLASITSNIAVWATLALNIPDFSRYARSQKDQFWGQMLFMPTSVIFMAAIGAMYAHVTLIVDGVAQYDPTAVLGQLNNKGIIIVMSLCTIVATLTTNIAANTVAPANGFSNIAPSKISYRGGLIITAVLCILYRPWWIFGSAGAFMFTFLGNCGTVLGPVAAILVADYFFVKKKRVDIYALYEEGNDKYEYSGGWNWKAIISWVVACLITMPGTFGIGGAAFAWINANSYIIGFLIAMFLYIALMKSETKSQVSEEEFEAMTKNEF